MKKTLFVYDFYVMRPLFWLSTIAQETNKVLQGGVSWPFIGSLRVYKCNFLKITARISAGGRKQLVVSDMLLFRCSWYHCLRGAQKVRALTQVATVLNWLNNAPLYRWKWPTINRFHFPAERSALFTDSHFVASLSLSVSFLKGEKKILISIKTLPL